MKKTFIKTLCLICCLSLMLSVLSACGNSVAEKDKKEYLEGETSNLATGEGIAENDRFRIDWDAEVGNVKIVDKQTEYVYSQIPLDYLEANRATMTIAKRNYVTPKPDENGNVEEPVFESETTVPELYSPIFIRFIPGGGNSKKETIYSNIGVTLQGRIASEKIDNGIRVTYYYDKYRIAVPVDYTISAEGFKMSVVPSEIYECGDYRIVEVGFSPMVCSLKNSEEGYVVVPSGSGGIMYTDSRGDGTPRTFSGEVYGFDPTIEVYQKLSNTEDIRLPVFGIVDGDRAVCGIIESGAEKCIINAQVGNASLGNSSAYVVCKVRGVNENIAVLELGRIRIYQYASDLIVSKEPITVGYHVLGADSASYTGIANYYSNWLVKNKGMSQSAESKLLYTQVVGGFLNNELMLGIPYKEIQTLTTYGEATDIAKKLSEASGGNMVLNMVGFGSCGISHGEIGGDFSLTEGSGDDDDLNGFISATKELGIDTYFNFDVVRFLDSSSGFGDTAVNANSAAAKQYKYNLSTKIRETDEYHYLLQRGELDGAAGKALGVVNGYGIPGIAFDTLGSVAYSDYYSDAYHNKEGMGAQVSKILKNVKDNNKKLLTNTANDYAAVMSTVILDVPTNSNMDISIDKDIPFYQTVFKGYVDFANDSINTAANYRTQFLHAMETGSGLSFALTARYSVDTVLMGHNFFYATVFEDNIELINSMLEESKEYLNAVKSAKIVGHEYVTATLTKTVFDNGVSVYVNYSENEATVENVKVPANNFVALGEGGAVIG